MTNKTEVEQRRHLRVPLGVTLDISMGDAAKRRATITDLSEGGMAVKTDADFEEGMLLHLRLNPALRAITSSGRAITRSGGDHPMQIRGEVRSALGPSGGLRRYGVRFHKIGRAIP